MTSVLTAGQGLIFMKVGVHAQEDLASIIDRKRKEIDDAGFALWGYGGATCYPNSMVQPFARERAAAGQKIFLCMQEMNSHHFAEQVRADEYSVDGREWHEIPGPINVLGSRFALAIKDLRRDDFALPLGRTRVAVGPSMGRSGDRYIQGRADKACLEFHGVVDGPLENEVPEIKISLVAELCEPYAVFLRNR